jgi:hypothetical protein
MVQHCVCFQNGDITECTTRPRWLSRVSLLSSSTLRNIPEVVFGTYAPSRQRGLFSQNALVFRTEKKSHKERDLGNSVGLIGAIPVVYVLTGYREIRQTQHSTRYVNIQFNKMSRKTCFDPLKGSSSGRIRSVYKCTKCTLT